MDGFTTIQHHGSLSFAAIRAVSHCLNWLPLHSQQQLQQQSPLAHLGQLQSSCTLRAWQFGMSIDGGGHAGEACEAVALIDHA
jgi:hypothetical protein